MNTNGVTFGNKHSINDWDLLMVSKSIGEAVPKTNYIEIPGSDGSKDLTDYFGDIRYSDRNLQFSFDIFSDSSNWWNIKKEITNYLQGKKMKIILDQDANYYFLGRCFVSNFTHETSVAHITIDATCDPYKYTINQTTDSFTINGKTTITLKNARRTVVPMITLSNQMLLELNANSFSLSPGTHKVLDVKLVEGDNKLTITGNGTISFTYQEGDL